MSTYHSPQPLRERPNRTAYVSQMQRSDFRRNDPGQTVPRHSEGDLIQNEHSQRKIARRFSRNGNPDSEEDQADGESDGADKKCWASTESLHGVNWRNSADPERKLDEPGYQTAGIEGESNVLL